MAFSDSRFRLRAYDDCIVWHRWYSAVCCDVVFSGNRDETEIGLHEAKWEQHKEHAYFGYNSYSSREASVWRP